MKYLKVAMLVLMLVAVLGQVAMLPPETFKDPIFAAQDGGGNSGGSDKEYTDFA